MASRISVVREKGLLQHHQEINVPILLNALKACSRSGNLKWGQEIHAKALKCGHHWNIYVANALINMYAKCGSMLGARQIFDSMTHPDVVSWTTLILGYASNVQGHTALDLLINMRTQGHVPNSVTLVAALKACKSLAGEGANRREVCLDRGRFIHNIAVETGSISDVYVQGTLVDLYAKCGSLVDACEEFDCMKSPDVVSWTALILGHTENGQSQKALNLFTKMRTNGPAPDCVTLVAALKACISFAVKDNSCELIKVVHSIAVETGYNSDNHVHSTLVDMYAKCGSMRDAREVFDSMKYPDIVSWNAFILGYANNGQGHFALDMFTRMITGGSVPNSVSLVAALKACTSIAVIGGDSRWAECRDIGRQIYNIALENGCSSEVYVQSTLIDMYAKCGSMADAHEVFDSIKRPGAVSWTALILGYSDNGQGHRALDLFSRMRTDGPAPDFITLAAALKSCALIGALEFGRTIHLELESENCLAVVMVNCLVDFYAKCGSLVEAQNVFDSHSETRDIVTWNALLAGFSSSGDTEAVFGLFERMQGAGFRPDGVTFLCILTCCSHAGLVEKGKECFDAMPMKYGVTPTVKHYTCMVDLYGRASKLDDAVALLKRMPCHPNDVTWMTVLGASNKWNNMEIGSLAFQSLLDINDNDASAYVLMEQIYGSNHKKRFQDKQHPCSMVR